MIYGKEEFLRAPQNRTDPYVEHPYDKFVRDAICSKCNNVIGQQYKHPSFKNYFDFHYDSEKNKYSYCPYCGHKFNFVEKTED